MLTAARGVTRAALHDVRHTGLEPQTSGPQTSRHQIADPRQACYSHVRALPWAGAPPPNPNPDLTLTLTLSLSLSLTLTLSLPLTLPLTRRTSAEIVAFMRGEEPSPPAKRRDCTDHECTDHDHSHAHHVLPPAVTHDEAGV